MEGIPPEACADAGIHGTRGTDDGEAGMLGKRPVAGKKGNASHEHVSDPLILYDLCTPETENEEIRRLGQNTLAMTMRHFGYGREVKVNTLDMCVDAVARCAVSRKRWKNLSSNA